MSRLASSSFSASRSGIPADSRRQFHDAVRVVADAEFRGVHSIPFDSMPRNFERSIFNPPGRLAPTRANDVFKPVRTFGAPHTTCRLRCPSQTTQTDNFSASGCRSTPRTSATTTSEKAPATGSTFDLQSRHRQRRWHELRPAARRIDEFPQPWLH